MGRPPDPQKKKRLVAATLALMRKKGYAATSVDDICTAARVTRGSFFFYAASKEEMALAALELYAAGFRAHFAGAGLEKVRDPRARLDRYLDACVALSHAPLMRDGCLLGVLGQEVARTHPRL